MTSSRPVSLLLIADTHAARRAADLPTPVRDAGDTTAATGLRLLNPGPPTDRRRQPFSTSTTGIAGNGGIGDVTLHRLPLRR